MAPSDRRPTSPPPVLSAARAHREPDEQPDEQEVRFESVPMTMLKQLASDLRSASQQLESAQLQLHQLATTDALTGCYNRRHYDEVVEAEVQRHRRNG